MGQTAEELRGQLASQRDDISRDLEAIGDRVSPGRMIERRQAAVRRRFDDARERVMGTADSASHGMRDTLASGATSTRETLGDAAQGTREVYEGNPLAMGLVALGAGLVAATLFPATRSERRLGSEVQPRLEHAAEQAAPAIKEVAGDLKDEIKPAAKQAMTEVSESAKEGAAHVRSEATQAASDTRDEAASQAEAVRETRR